MEEKANSNWFKKHPLISTIIILGIFVFIFDFLSNNNTAPSEQPNTNEPPSATTLPSAQKINQNKPYHIGEEVRIADSILTAYNIAEDHEFDDTAAAPKQGKKYIVVDVNMENSSSVSIDANPVDFQLQDSQNYTYHVTAGKEPSFGLMPLQPGQTTRGSLTYEIPINATGFELIYTPSWLNNVQAIIKLSN